MVEAQAAGEVIAALAAGTRGDVLAQAHRHEPQLASKLMFLTCALASAYGTSYVLSANAPDGLPATFLQVCTEMRDARSDARRDTRRDARRDARRGSHLQYSHESRFGLKISKFDSESLADCVRWSTNISCHSSP